MTDARRLSQDRWQDFGCLCNVLFGFSIVGAVCGAGYGLLVYLASNTYFRLLHEDLGEEAYFAAIEGAARLADVLFAAMGVCAAAVVVASGSMFIARRGGSRYSRVAMRVFVAAVGVATLAVGFAIAVSVAHSWFYRGYEAEFGERAMSVTMERSGMLAADMVVSIVLVYSPAALAAGSVIASRMRLRATTVHDSTAT